MHPKKPKKKFRVRIKQASSRPASRQDPKQDNPAAVVAKKSVLDRIAEYVRAADDPSLGAQYAAIFGRERPIDDLLATNLHLISGMKRSVSAAFEAHLVEHAVPVFRQVTRIGITPGSNAECLVPAIRKTARIYDQAKVDLIAAVQFVPVPYGTDPHGVGLALQLDAIFFGDDADRQVEAKERSARVRSGFARSAVQRLYGDEDARSKAIKDVIIPNYSGEPIDNSFLNLDIGAEWPDDADVGVRAFIAMMARAQLPLKSMLILLGAGKSVFAHATTEAKRQLSEACKATPYVIHRDGLVHFFAAELRRLGLNDVNVPLVMLR